MKKIFCLLLAAAMLIGLFAACSKKKTETSSTENVLEENIFEPMGETTQSQDPTKSTEGQNSSTPTQNQQSSGSAQSTESTTQNQQSSGSTQTTEPIILNPTESAAPTTTATSPAEESTESTEPGNTLAAEYEAYKTMSSAEKKKFRETFDSTTEFFKWYNAALKAYKDSIPSTVIPADGVITLNPTSP